MEENKDFRAFRYGDRVSPGYSLKIEHSITCEQKDISALIAKGEDALLALHKDSVDSEQKAFDIVVAAANQWEQQAAYTQMINRAVEYLRTPEVKHSNNQWQKNDGYRDGEEISNRVYSMTCSVWEDTKYNRETKESVPIAWYVSWDVYLKSPKEGYGKQIAGQRNKRYTDKAAAMKYLEGRKKAYAHLFTELSPPIPQQYENHFTVHGALLPGYTVEGKEPAKAAAVISDGGISMPEKAEKPSVLGKLSEAKRDAKESGQPVRQGEKSQPEERSSL